MVACRARNLDPAWPMLIVAARRTIERMEYRMLQTTPAATRQELMARVRAMAERFGGRVAAAEEGRRIPAESAADMLNAGLARVLLPKRYGGYGLDFDTWLDVAVEIAKLDASHAWCASLIIHHAHIITQFPEHAQQAVWADGPDVAIAASVAPRTQVARVDGGYRLSGQQSAFASGVDHSTWVIVGGIAPQAAEPEWLLFMIPPGQYTVRDTWFTTGMRGTGSKTIVTDNVFVPGAHVLAVSDLRQAKSPGRLVNDGLIYRLPFYFYAPLTFAAPMLGAAQGAYQHFRDWTRKRVAGDGAAVADKTSVQVRLARVAADLDAAELLLRRAALAHHGAQAEWPQLVARSVRDYARVSELTVAAVDELLALSGTAGFADSHPVQRAWRDVHFASTHISVNPDMNYGHFGRTELGVPRDPNRPFF
jgi:3-hydroxy-9,10-secoandrosta-1,3,5(10)-triene-9,17-dione monooxygenase